MNADLPHRKAYKGFPMEGFVARRYAKLRRSGSQLEEVRAQAGQLTVGLPAGAEILEVAPGPGYLAIELARLGRFHVTGLDVSRTFVEIERQNARKAEVSADFHQGNAARMNFAGGSFDLVICQAAFKNFAEPDRAIAEMYRVLRPGGVAVIQDLRRDAPDSAIRSEVAEMRLGRFGAWMTRRILGGLRRRAYTVEEFQGMAGASAFGDAEVTPSGIGVEVRLTKRAPGTHRADDPPTPRDEAAKALTGAAR